MATDKTKIAIACQGGCSQTAFTAGVLKGLFEEEVHRDFQTASLSGTSGDRGYCIPFIEMSAGLQARLDYESKLDRSPENIGALMADGETQARVFLKERAGAHG